MKMKEMKEMNARISRAAEVMMVAFGSEDVLRSLKEFDESDNEALRDQSEITSDDIVKVLTMIFGDVSSLGNVLFGNVFCSYLDLVMLRNLTKAIRTLHRNRDSRIHTVETLRDIGAYFSYLALCINSGILGHRLALELLTAAVMLYDTCQKMMPYVFEDISFEDSDSNVGDDIMYAVSIR